jgi:Development and cell death domain
MHDTEIAARQIAIGAVHALISQDTYVLSLTWCRRNLGEDSKLGGVVFGCTHETMDECLRSMIFGLPKSHWSYVYYIEPGLPIFLFNYHDRNMHGIFRAVSYGQLDINPHGAQMPSRTAACFLWVVRPLIRMLC